MADRNKRLITQFKCPKCKGNPYNLWGMEVKPGSGIYEHRFWPGSDGQGTPPPDPKDLRCPNCQVELTRA